MIRVWIDGVERTSLVKMDSIRKKDVTNDQVDTMALTLTKVKGFTPTLNSEVYLWEEDYELLDEDGVVMLFDDDLEVDIGYRVGYGGTIKRIDETVEDKIKIMFNVEMSDFGQNFGARLANQRFEDMTAGDIIRDLVPVYAPGFTTVGVEDGPVIPSISFDRIPLNQAIQKLAAQTNYYWYVDYNKDLHFFAKNSEVAPFNLTDAGGKYLWDTLTLSRDVNQVRNQIVVRGGMEKSATTRTERFTTPSDDVSVRRLFRLAYQYDSKPTVTVAGTPQDVGIDGQDADTLFDVMWNKDQKYLRFTTGNEPTAGQVVENTGYPLFPVIVQALDADSAAEFAIEGFDGIYEYLIKDDRITSRDEALQRAAAELQAYGRSLVEGQFQTYEVGLRSGQMINIQSDTREIDEDCVIQSVDFQTRGDQGLLYTVSFATKKTLGIISILQKLLARDTESPSDDLAILLQLLQITDSLQFTDAMGGFTVTTTQNYVWGADSTYSITLTTDPTKVSGSGPLNNYRMYVDLAAFPALFHSNVKSDGSDIRVYADDGTELPREVIYDGSTDTGSLWFLCSLDGSSPTIFHIGYGNPEMTEPAAGAVNGKYAVWGANAKYVGHLGGGTPNANDSSLNAYNGTLVGSPTVTPGKIGNALTFDGSTQKVDLPVGAIVPAASDIVIATWIKKLTTSQYRFMSRWHGENTSRTPSFGYGSPGVYYFQLRNATPTTYTVDSTGKVTGVNAWHRLWGMWNKTTGVLRFYIDGVLMGTQTIAPGSSSSGGNAPLFMNSGDSGNNFTQGQQQESWTFTQETGFTADYVATEYENQNSPSTFYALSGQNTFVFPNEGYWDAATWDA